MSIRNQTLYKYRGYTAHALEMLVNRECYFVSPIQLNDPYDCRINIRESLRAALETAEKNQNKKIQERLAQFGKIDHVYERMDKDLASLGVFSLSKTPTHVLLWSHYASNHSGFCVGLRPSDSLATHENPYQIVGASDVAYSATNPFIEYFQELALAPTVPEWNEFWVSLLSMGMAVKAESWKYEEEVRILRQIPGTVPFSPRDLTEIVFGLNMESQNRTTIRRILSGAEWAHVSFKEIVRADGFALTVKDMGAT